MFERESNFLDGRLVHGNLLASPDGNCEFLSGSPSAELIDFYVNVNFHFDRGLPF
jgi:hypothetical protein